MDKLRERYIALQKAFWDSDGGAASILALYEFKDELEKCGETEAKPVLVDVYELLELKRAPASYSAKFAIRRIESSSKSSAICGNTAQTATRT